MNSLQQWKDKGLLADSAIHQLKLFADLIFQWNPKVNLTGYKKKEEIEKFLIGESVSAVPVLSLHSKNVLDFGSGAGIPGLVWAIAEPSARITSLEVRQKKVAFQKEAARSIGIDAEILLGRFPEVAPDRKFDLIVSRAIRFSPQLWKEGERLLKPGGLFVRFAGRNQQEPGWNTIPISERSSVLVRSL